MMVCLPGSLYDRKNAGRDQGLHLGLLITETFLAASAVRFYDSADFLHYPYQSDVFKGFKSQ